MPSGTVTGRGPGPAPRQRARRQALAVLLSLILLPTVVAIADRGSGPDPAASVLSIPSTTLPQVSSSTVGWSTFHGSENRSGYSPISGPPTSHSLWVSCPSTLPVRVGPVLDSTRVYVSDNLGNVVALNRSGNGNVQWREPLGTTPTTPDLVGSVLVIGGSDGYLTALNSSTGAIRWSSNVGGPVDQGVSVDNGTVFAGLSNGNLVAVSLSDGSRQWSVRIGGALEGAPTVQGGTLYVASTNGTLVALSERGTILWSRSIGALVSTAVAAFGPTLVVGDASGNITALSTNGGALLWRASGSLAGDRIESTPAVTPTTVFAATDLGGVYAFDLGNGTLRWAHQTPYAGYRVLASPVATPTGMYLIDAAEMLDYYAAADGRLIWQASLAATASYSTPALSAGLLYVANDVGCVYDFGSEFAGVPWPVFGSVLNASGPPLAGATLAVGSMVVTTAADGTFSFLLPNGTYRFDVFDGGYVPVTALEVVNGGLGPLVFRLIPLPLYPVTGFVRDSHSGRPLAGVNVTLDGAYGFTRFVATFSDGGFRVSAPNGTDYLSVQGPPGYESTALHVTVAGGVLEPVVISLDPTTLSVGANQPVGSALLLAVVALLAAALVVGVWSVQRERRAAGLPPGILSPFGRFICMRLMLIPVQGIVILTLLYIFGTFFPAVIHQANPCSLLSSGCQSCSWSNFLCVTRAFGGGLWTFLDNLFTGSWGYASYNQLNLPATQFLDWWAPNSVELALVALPLSALIAYPLGLISGWRRDGVVDTGIRLSSLVGLLVPSFLIVLLILGSAYTPFTNTLGDTPYGLLPTPVWFAAHGGQPSWIGVGSNTSPTGFAIVDGAWHGDWSFEYLVVAKTLLQAFAIAALYAAIYLRFARHAVAEAAGAAYITAARARGVPDSALLWRHTRRRVLPIFVLIFGLTLPVYIGTQALVEALFSDQGVGTLLLGEMTHVQSTAFGFATASQGYHVGNFYQVTIFLMVFVVLVGNLFSDVLARVLDPRTAEPGAR